MCSNQSLWLNRIAFVKWMLIFFHTLTSNTWPILLLFVTLVKISLTQGTLTSSSSFSDDDDNPANRRADECKRTSITLDERRLQLLFSLVYRCHDIRSSRRNETFQCLWRWISNRRSSTQVLSIFHTRILLTLRRLLHDIQGSITHREKKHRLDHVLLGSSNRSTNPHSYSLTRSQRYPCGCQLFGFTAFLQISLYRSKRQTRTYCHDSRVQYYTSTSIK